MTTTTAPRGWRSPALWLILLGSLVLNTHRIGHPGLHYFDESFHAIVARNLLKHPLRPTLIDAPYLPYDATHWGENHVWLHKPILPLWTIAGSFALLGVNTTGVAAPVGLARDGRRGPDVPDRPGACSTAGSALIAAVAPGDQPGDHHAGARIFVQRSRRRRAPVLGRGRPLFPWPRAMRSGFVGRRPGGGRRSRVGVPLQELPRGAPDGPGGDGLALAEGRAGERRDDSRLEARHFARPGRGDPG